MPRQARLGHTMPGQAKPSQQGQLDQTSATMEAWQSWLAHVDSLPVHAGWPGIVELPRPCLRCDLWWRPCRTHEHSSQNSLTTQRRRLRSRPAKPGQPRSRQAMAGYAEAGKARPSQARPGQARPGQARSCQGRSGQSRLGKIRPGQARLGQARLGHAMSGQAMPCQAGPGQAIPEQVGPGQVRAAQVRTCRPCQARLGQARPSEVRPGQARPGQARPSQQSQLDQTSASREAWLSWLDEGDSLSGHAGWPGVVELPRRCLRCDSWSRRCRAHAHLRNSLTTQRRSLSLGVGSAPVCNLAFVGDALPTPVRRIPCVFVGCRPRRFGGPAAPTP